MLLDDVLKISAHQGWSLQEVLDLDLLTLGCVLASVDRLEAEDTINRTTIAALASSVGFGGDASSLDNFLDPYYELIGVKSSSSGIQGLMSNLGGGF